MLEAKAPRAANFELMRVVAMLMVMVLHALGHGGVLEQYAFGSVGYVLFWTLETLAYIAVDLFVLITGYFMVNTRTKVSRIVKLLVQVWFYSVLGLAIYVFIFDKRVGINEAIAVVFPISGGEYWFASAYMVLILLSFALSKALHAINMRQCVYLIMILLGIFCVAPTLLPWSKGWLNDGYTFVWFIVLYLVGGCIRLHGDELARRFGWMRKKRFLLAVYLIFSGGGIISRLIIGLVSTAVTGNETGTDLLYAYNSVTVFSASVCFFLLFKNLHIRSERIKRLSVALGSVCFGAYLLTDHDLIREPLWAWVALPRRCAQGLVYAVAWTIAVTLALFAAGCLFEAARLRLMAALRLPERLRALDVRAERAYSRFFGG